MAFPQIGLYPVSQLQVAAFFFRSYIDARRPQPFKVFLTQLRIDDMEGLLTALEAFLDKRQQHLILLVAVVEKGTDMTFCAKHAAGEPDGLIALVALTGSLSTKFGVIISRIHRQSPFIKLLGSCRACRGLSGGAQFSEIRAYPPGLHRAEEG